MAQRNQNVKPSSQNNPYAEAVSTDDAVRDLMGRKNPDLMPWSKTPTYRRTMRHFAASLAAYITIVLILGGIISAVLGQALLGIEVIVGFLVLIVLGYIPLARWLYYRSIKPKRPRMDGAVLGTAYTHYIEVHHAIEPGNPTAEQGTKALLAGETEEYAIDYAREPNPHVVIVGGSGSGKTVTLRAFIVRNCMQLGVPFLIIDWNGEQEDWAKEAGAVLWNVPSTMKLNPFSRRGKSIPDRTAMLMDLFQFGAGLTYLQAGRLRTMAYQMYQEGEPTLIDLWHQASEAMNDRAKPPDERQYMAWIEQRLKMIQRVIGYEPEEFWDSLFKRNNVVSLRGLSEVEKGVAAYAIFQRVYEIFNEKPELNKKMQLMMVLDEAWKILQSQQQDKQEALPSQIVRLGRKYGFGILVSTQQLTDLPPTFLNSSAIQIIHRYRETSTTMSAASLYNLGQFETAYLGTAKPGEAMVVDQYRSQLGQWWLDYIKVAMLNKEEMKVLSELYDTYEPKPINETQLPIDEYWNKPKEPEQPKEQEEVKIPFMPPKDRPTATVHAALLAINYNKDAPLITLVKYLKEKGFVTGDPTIYGSQGRKGLFDVAIEIGLVEKKEGGFRLTKKGEKWIGPEKIIESEASVGGEVHKQLLIKTIEYLHDKNMLVTAPSEREAPDLIAYPVDEKKKYLWDDDNRRAYEIQTTARKENVMANKARNDKDKLKTTWITYDNEIMDEIRKLTDNKDEYLIIKM